MSVGPTKNLIKYLITSDMDMEADYDGITKINIVDWLLNKE